VPAAAVIPAPIAYIKVVAVKKLVVGSRFRADGSGSPGTVCPDDFGSSFVVLLTECHGWLPRLL
jgi:hypothetical protein